MSHKLKGIGESKYLPEIIPSETVEADSLNNGAIRATASHKFETPPDMLIGRLSFSHIREIMAIDDPFERFFSCHPKSPVAVNQFITFEHDIDHVYEPTVHDGVAIETHRILGVSPL